MLALGLLVGACWAAKFEECVAFGTIVDDSCLGRSNEGGDMLGRTRSMVHKNIVESEMSVDEERQEVPTVAVPHSQLSSKKAAQVAAPNIRLAEAKSALAPKMSQPQQQMPGRSVASSLIEVLHRINVGTVMEALGSRYTNTTVLQSVKNRIATEIHSFFRRLAVSELELVASRASWFSVFFVVPLAVGLIGLLVAMRAWWKDAVANKDHEGWGHPKSWPARGSLRDASSMPQPLQDTARGSQLPSITSIRASVGRPRELPHSPPAGRSVTPPKRSVTPPHAEVESAKFPINRLAWEEHLCSELVVPEGNECSLLLPRLTETRFSASGVLSITGDNGVPVLYAAYTLAERPPLSADEQPGNGKRLVLRSALEDTILASCRDAQPETSGGPPQLMIVNKAEEPFGMLRATGATGGGPKGSYTVSLSNGKKMFFRRDIQALSLCITDEDGWLLCCSEEGDERGRPICISPHVDAGLVVIAMVGIDILDMNQAARGSADRAMPRLDASRPRTPQQPQSRTNSGSRGVSK